MSQQQQSQQPEQPQQPQQPNWLAIIIVSALVSGTTQIIVSHFDAIYPTVSTYIFKFIHNNYSEIQNYLHLLAWGVVIFVGLWVIWFIFNLIRFLIKEIIYYRSSRQFKKENDLYQEAIFEPPSTTTRQ